jgi:hypothetical protein
MCSQALLAAPIAQDAFKLSGRFHTLPGTLNVDNCNDAVLRQALPFCAGHMGHHSQG